MKTRLALAAGAAVFLLLATANSGGYRYGVSDQAFYIPAIARAADASLFPRDAEILAPQMRAWLGDDLMAGALRARNADLPQLLAILYVLGALTLFAAAVFLARGLGASWWAVAAATALLTLRHRIARTGANSLEGYMHPRMIAFALGLVALGFVVRRRLIAAWGLVLLAAVVHPTTALWFGAVLVGAAVARLDRRSLWNLLILVPIPFIWRHLTQSPRMDPAWLAVLGEKDYLFPHAWPAYAWAINLLYPVVLVAIYRRRRALGRIVAGEWSLLVGLLALVAGFLVSVPIAAAAVAPIVQLQVNRVFWVLDAVTAVYIAWWLMDDVAARRRAQVMVAALLVCAACARGVFILVDTGRPLARIDLPDDEWTDVMRWLRTQPADWLVLADPAHAWLNGPSVRVAAFRDTVLEQSKDSAMAMYDRAIAMRVAERAAAIGDFSSLGADALRAIGQRYGARVVVAPRDRAIALPVLYQNARFAAYDIR